MDDYNVIFCTVPSQEDGKKIGNILVKERLAACVNIVSGITSIYEWKGELCDDSEFLMIIKSRKGLFENIKKRIVENHPYELPEIISLSIDDGLEPYLDWISENTTK